MCKTALAVFSLKAFQQLAFTVDSALPTVANVFWFEGDPLNINTAMLNVWFCGLLVKFPFLHLVSVQKHTLAVLLLDKVNSEAVTTNKAKFVPHGCCVEI